MQNLTSYGRQWPQARQVGQDRQVGQSRWVGSWLAMALLVIAPAVWAQQQPPKSAPAQNAPPPSDLEPGVNTSAPPPPDSAPPPMPAPAPAAAASRTKEPAAQESAASKPKGEVASKTDTAAAGADKGGKKGSGKAEDHLQLDTTQITGNQELPKVLYIVPWKRSDLGDLLGKPANSLLDEVLQPVDRDVFRRENRYYDALKPDAGGKANGAAGQTSGDKH